MNASTSLDEYRWLTGGDGHEWLERATDNHRALHIVAAELRRQLPPARVHLVLEQVELRRRAVRKFGQAAAMFFTKNGLEQATDQWIAAYKAARFAPGEPIADLCCGIGGDLLALAERGPVVGVESNPAVVELARANLAGVFGKAAESKRVEWRWAETFNVAGVTAWHCDPDRRPEGLRTTRVELQAPNEAALSLLLATNANGAIKLAPASNAPQMWSDQAELEWISRGRECRQMVGWFGDLARRPGTRVATIVFTDHRPEHSFAGSPDTTAEVRESIDRFVFVPDPAVFAARLVSALAARHGLAKIGAEGARPAGYLTGRKPVVEPLLDRFEVIDRLPLDVKQLTRYLRNRQIGRLEIKHRGMPLDPDVFRRRLRLKGDHAATLLATPVGCRVMAVLAQRCGKQ